MSDKNALRVTRINPIMKFFAYTHLPSSLGTVSESISKVAAEMNDTLPDCAEKSTGLRKLLEAKDCFVRARLSGEVTHME